MGICGMIFDSSTSVGMAMTIFDKDPGSDQIRGHQVGRKLDPLKVEVKSAGEGTHQQGLAEAGNPFKEDMATGDHCDHRVLDDLVLADDYLLDFGF